MSNYTDFAAKALEALYIETDGNLSSRVQLLPMLAKFGIQIEKDHWINTLQNEWAQDEIAQFIGAGSPEGLSRPIVAIQWRGVRQAETRLSVTLGAGESSKTATTTGATLSDAATSPTEIVPLSNSVVAYGPNDVVLHPVPPSAGTAPTSIQFSSIAEAEIVPASDRVVRFDHNNPAYGKISEAISDVREAVRATNDLEIKSEDRERILAALDAAKSLWNAVQIRVIHLKVGILLTLEDATKFLASTAKAVAAALLVDTFKAFVKNHTGVDLDNL